MVNKEAEFRINQEPIPGSIGFVFSGQGLSSRRILYDHAAALFAINSSAVEKSMLLMQDVSGLPLFQYIEGGDEKVLGRTDVVQAVIHGLHLAVIDLLQPVFSDPKQIAKVAGHSAGEIAAFVASGVLSAEDSARVVVERANAMHESSLIAKSGLIIPRGLTGEQVANILINTQGMIKAEGWEGECISLALINGHGAEIIGGTENALSYFEQMASMAGAKGVIRVDAEGAFHTEAMRKAADSFGSFFRQIPLQEARIPVVLNDGVETIDPEKMREEHISRMTEFVNWASAMGKFIRMEKIVKIGPSGQVPGMNSVPRSRQISITDFLRKG